MLARRSLGAGGKIENYKLVGNIPYYITSYLIRTIFEKWPQPKLIVLMVQKEVAQRIMAGTALPAGRQAHMNLLALSVQLYAEPKIISYVSRGSFRPMPKVDSAVIRLTPQPKVHEQNRKEMLSFISSAFKEKRKMLLGVLARNGSISRETLGEILGKIGINETARAENLSLQQWQKLHRSLTRQ